MASNPRKGRLKKSIYLRLQGIVIASAATAILLLWAGLFYHLHMQREVAVAQTHRDVANLASALEEQVERLFVGVDQVMQFMQLDFAQDRANFRFHTWMERSTSLRTVAIQVSMFDAEGELIASRTPPRPDLPSFNIRDREYYRALSVQPDAGLYVDRTVTGRLTGRRVFQLARRLNEADGRFAGILVVSLDPDYFADQFKTIDVGARGSVALFGRDGYMRARQPFAPGMYDVSARTISTGRGVFEHLKQSTHGTYQVVSAFDAGERIFGYRAVQDLPLVVTVGKLVSEVMLPFEAEQRRVMAVGICGSLVLLAALFFIVRQLDRRRRRDALLRTAEAALRENALRLESTLEAMDQGLLMIDAAGIVQVSNRRAVELLDLPVDLMSAPPSYRSVRDHARRAGRWGRLTGETPTWLLSADRRSQDVRCERQTDDGRILEIRSVPTLNEGVVQTFTDITHLKEAEAAAQAAEHAAQTANTRLLLAEQIAQVGHWRIELPSDELTWSDEIYRMHGVDRASFALSVETAIAAYHPDDRAEVARHVGHAIANAETFEFSLRILRADGAVRDVVSRGMCEFGPAGHVTAVFGTIMDVTELRQVERIAAQTASLLATTLDSMDQGLLVVSPEGRVEVCNTRATALLGLPPEIMAAKPTAQEVLDLQWAAGEFDHADVEVRRLMRQGGMVSGAHTYTRVRPNGTVLEIRTVPMAGGGIVRTYSDITARRAAEEAMQASEARYRLLAETTTDVITRLDLDFKRQYVSPACRQLLGFEPHEMLGNQPSQAMHPDDAPVVRALAQRLVAGEIAGHKATATYRVRHKRGHWVRLEAGMRLVHDAAGQANSIVCSLRDVSERMAAEEARAVSEARYRLLADNASDLIVLGHQDGRRSYISPAVHAMLGYTVEEAHGIPMRDWIHPDDRARVFATTSALTAKEPTSSVVYRLRHKSGHHIWAEAAFQRVEEGDEIRIITAIRDVTERQRQARHLEQAKAAAEAGARVKAEFLANMSHELRTPLTGILGVHDLLESDPELSPRQRHFVELAQQSGRSLLTIVNDILDFSKIEAGQMAIERVPFSLRDLVESCRALGAETIRQDHLALVVEVAPETPDLLLGDPTRVRQVLLNLTTNALKFTRQGRVEIRATWPAGRLRLAVSDTGVGIAPDALPHLFERFSQADGSTTRRFGGTGLGLAICKRLVETMRGSIGVESKPGQGSTFWVELPLDPAEPARSGGGKASSPARSAMRVRRILVAEDNVINYQIIRAMLVQRGHEAVMVEDGLAVVEAYKGSAFDIVLMDVQMPGQDGLSATRAIRALERGGRIRRTPIVALTANAMEEEVVRCREAGMDAHVAKPIEWNTLFDTIESLCRSDEASNEAEDPAGPAAPSLPVLDERELDTLASFLGPDRVTAFLGSFGRQTERCLALASAEDVTAADIASQAHTLVSLSGQLGFLELSAFCAALETDARRGAGLDRLPTLRTLIERARTASVGSRYARPPSASDAA